MIRIPTLLPAWFDDRALNVAISAALNLLLGVTYFASSPGAFSSPSYAALRDDPGGLASWAAAMLAAAVVIAGGLALGASSTRVALLVVALLHAYLTIGFIQAAPLGGASPWGWVWFGFFTIRLVGQAVGFRTPRRVA